LPQLGVRRDLQEVRQLLRLREDGHDAAREARDGARNDERDVAPLEHEPKAKGSDEDNWTG